MFVLMNMKPCDLVPADWLIPSFLQVAALQKAMDIKLESQFFQEAARVELQQSVAEDEGKDWGAFQAMLLIVTTSSGSLLTYSFQSIFS